MQTVTRAAFLLVCMLCLIGPLFSQQTAKEHFDKGSEEYWSGHYNNALTSYNKAISLDSTQAIYYLERGKVYFHIQRHDKALLDFNSCLVRNPYNSEAYAMRSRIKYQMKDYDGAVRDQDVAKDLQKPKGTQSLLGWEYVKKGDNDRACLSWVRQLKANYTHKYDLEAIKGWCDTQQMKGDTISIDTRIFSYEIEGLIHLQKRGFDKAIDMFERAHKLIMKAPDSSLYVRAYLEELDYNLYYKWTEILLMDKNYDQAIARFADLQKRMPTAWKIDYAMSLLTSSKGDPSTALNILDTAFSKGMTWTHLNADPGLLQAVQGVSGFDAFKKAHPDPADVIEKKGEKK